MLQESAGVFVGKAEDHDELGERFIVARSATPDTKRDQNSLLLLRRNFFREDSIVDHTSKVALRPHVAHPLPAHRSTDCPLSSGLAWPLPLSYPSHEYTASTWPLLHPASLGAPSPRHVTYHSSPRVAKPREPLLLTWPQHPTGPSHSPKPCDGARDFQLAAIFSPSLSIFLHPSPRAHAVAPSGRNARSACMRLVPAPTTCPLSAHPFFGSLRS